MLKSAAASVFHYTGLRSAVGRWRRAQSGGRRILIVGYHRVVDDFTGELQRSIPGTLISKETFRRHLEEAHAAGFRFATLTEALDVMAGRKVAHQDLFVVTFDDGYRDVYRHAFPILQWMGVPSVMYLASDYVGTDRRFNHDRLFHLVRLCQRRRFRPLYEALPTAAPALMEPILGGQKTLSVALDDFIGEYATELLEAIIGGLEAQLGEDANTLPEQGDVMSWDEVLRMARGGMELGAHTRTHRVLTLEPRQVMEKEIAGSRAAIEARAGSPVRDFAYCNGWYSDEVVAALKHCGFRSAMTTEDYPNRLGGDPFSLKRKVLWENFSVGINGDYSSPMTRCQLDDVFGALGVNHPVPGRRPPNLSRATLAATPGSR
jgi:peptidoglycan/xylan/chitin deacetylase (PgdA/CDA1 family)